MSTATKSNATVQTGSQELDQAGKMVAEISFSAVGAASVAIGLWAVACMVGGIVSAGGPITLVSSWFKAVNGL